MRWKETIYRRMAAALTAVFCIGCIGPAAPVYGAIVPLSGGVWQEGAGRGTPPEAGEGPHEKPRPGTQSEPVENPGSVEKPGPVEESGPVKEPGSAAKPEPGMESGPDDEPAFPTAPLSLMGTPSEADYASDYEEMKAWMAASKRTGGTLYLAGDIVIEGDEAIQGGFRAPQMTVDTGEYSIIVRGQLYLSASNMKFVGDGGGSGVFHVEEGGILHIDMLGGISAREGAAVCQEDGAFFGHYPEYAAVDGEIRAPSNPMAVSMAPVQNGAPSLVVEAGEDGVEKAAGALPRLRQRAAICRDGLYLMMDEDYPVEWDLEPEEETLSNRQRATVYGDFYSPDASMAGLETVKRPYCHVVFADREATFLGVSASINASGGLKVIGQYLVKGGPCVVVPLISYDDGETWQEMEGQEEWYDGEGEECTLGLWSHDARPFSLCLEIVRQGEPSAYSDVLKWEDGELVPGKDYEGNRGGGTHIGGGETLPPLPGDPDREPNPQVPQRPGGDPDPEGPQGPGGEPNLETPRPPDEEPNLGIPQPSGENPAPQPPGRPDHSESHLGSSSERGQSSGSGGSPGIGADRAAPELVEADIEAPNSGEITADETKRTDPSGLGPEWKRTGGEVSQGEEESGLKGEPQVGEALRSEEEPQHEEDLRAGKEPQPGKEPQSGEEPQPGEEPPPGIEPLPGAAASSAARNAGPPSAAVQILAGAAALIFIFGGALWLKPGAWIRRLRGFLKKDR